MSHSRRQFLTGGLVAAAATVVQQLPAADVPASATGGGVSNPTEPAGRGTRQDLDQVFEFVRAGHGNLPRVEAMLTEDPQLALAAWDWGNGDWETALEGAAHVGNRATALYLLDHGARHTLTCSAMLGERDTVRAALRAQPVLANTTGPHGLTLLYHAAISGDVALAEDIASLVKDRAHHANQALSAAARGGHAPMTAWLLANGVTDLNVKDGLGKTAATHAAELDFPAVSELLRIHATQ